MTRIAVVMCTMAIFCVLISTASAVDTNEITGTVQKAGVWFGVGPYVTLQEAPDKKFILNQDLAIKAGVMETNDGAVFLSAESNWKGQKLTILYDKTEKERYGSKYLVVISLEKK